MHQWLDLRMYVPEDLMLKGDRMSMAHSLEVRFPFLDHTLLEFALTNPSSMNIVDGHNGKSILKEALRGLVPEDVMFRKKQGFSLPYTDWLRGPLRHFVQDLLLPRDAWIYQYLQPSYIQSLVNAFE